MAQKLRYPPSQNFLQKTLGAQLLTGATASATLNNTTGVQNKPGVMIVDRVDSNNVETPSKREVIQYNATSGSTVTTLTRNADGSGTDQDHAVGAIVEFGPDILWAQSVIDGLNEVVDPTTGSLDTTKVVTPTGSQTLTNKTLTAPLINVGSDAQGDVYYRNGSGVFTRLAPGTSGQFLKTQGAEADPIWASASSVASVVDEDDSGGSSTSSATAAAITGADVSVTTSSTCNIVIQAYVQAYANPGAAAGYGIQFHDGTSLVGVEMRTDLIAGNRRQVIPVQFIKQSAASGTYTFTVYHRSLDGATSCTAEAVNITAYTLPA